MTSSSGAGSAERDGGAAAPVAAEGEKDLFAATRAAIANLEKGEEAKSDQEPEAQEPEAQEPEAQEPEAQQPEAQQPEAQEPEDRPAAGAKLEKSEGLEKKKAAEEYAVAEEIKPAQAPAGKLGRRAYARVPLKTKIGLATQSNFYTGFTNDVSEGGVFVASHQVLPIGTEVQVEVSFADVGGPPIKTRGRVRWVRDEQRDGQAEPGMGVEFLDLDEDHRQWIEDFVKKRQPIFFEPEIDAPVAAEGDARRELENLQGSRWKLVVAFAIAVVAILVTVVYLFTASGK